MSSSNDIRSLFPDTSPSSYAWIPEWAILYPDPFPYRKYTPLSSPTTSPSLATSPTLSFVTDNSPPVSPSLATSLTVENLSFSLEALWNISKDYLTSPALPQITLDVESVSSLTTDKTTSIVKETLPKENPLGVIDPGKGILPLLAQFQDSSKTEVVAAINKLCSLSKPECLELLIRLCQKWKDLPALSMQAILHFLSGMDTSSIRSSGNAHMVEITLSAQNKTPSPASIELLLRKLFRGSSIDRDVVVLHNFFENCRPSISSPFMLGLLRVIPTYPTPVQKEVWESYFLEYRGIENALISAPLKVAYCHAAACFVAEALKDNSSVRETGKKVYRFHSVTWKKNISEVFLSKHSLSIEQVINIRAVCHSHRINYESLDRFQKQTTVLLSGNQVRDQYQRVASIFDSIVLFEDRDRVDQIIAQKIVLLVAPTDNIFSVFVGAVLNLQLSRTALVVLSHNAVQKKDQNKLFNLYFNNEQAKVLSSFSHFSYENLDYPYVSTRTILFAHFRQITSAQNIPNLKRVYFLTRVYFSFILLEFLGSSPFSMREIDNQFLLRSFDSNNIVKLYDDFPRSFDKMLVAYASALLYNNKNRECIEFVNKMLSKLSRTDPFVPELEGALLHALLATEGPTAKAKELYDRTFAYVEADPNRSHSSLLFKLLSTTARLKKIESTAEAFKAKAGSTFVPLESLSWMALHHQYPVDRSSLEILHQKALEAEAPNNIPFIMMKLSLMLYHKLFDEAMVMIQGYEEILPDLGFIYYRARAYFDPACPEKTDPRRINMFLEMAFDRSPLWIDVSIALWLLRCKYPDIITTKNREWVDPTSQQDTKYREPLGISKEEFCSRLQFYAGGGVSEVLHLIKPPYEKPSDFADRLKVLVTEKNVSIHLILSSLTIVPQKND